MQNNLDLYHAVMGEMWTDEHRRPGAARQQAAGRQARSFKRAGRPSVRNIAKASKGSRAAVFKRIRAGGCKTRQSLGNQLAYVNDKAIFAYSTMTNSLGAGDVLSEADKDRIIEQWSGTWRGSTKLGFTSHMLLSFPTDVTADQVRDIAMDWCEHFFESGHYGDERDYVLAVHTDRDHPHAHILLNNRGQDQGQWFACWAEGAMSPQLMREKRAEIAETYGVALDATTRLERGIFMRPAGLEEIYAAKAEGRTAREIAPTPQEAAMAQAAMIEFAKDYRNVADTLDRADKAHLSSAVRQMANSLDAGRKWKINEEQMDLREINTVGEAIEFAEGRIEAIRMKTDNLEPQERVAFELKAAPVVAKLSQMVPDPELRTAYNQVLAETYPPGLEAADIAELVVDGQRSKELGEALEYGQSIGLNTDETLARFEAGGTNNHGLAQAWADRDMSAILGKDGVALDDASTEQVSAAVAKLDGFQMRLAKELGVELESPFEVPDRDRQTEDLRKGLANPKTGHVLDDTGSAETLDIPNDIGVVGLETAESPNVYLSSLALELREGDLDADQKDIVQRTLVAELHKELGDEGLAELDRGNWRVLEDVLPAAYDQIGVTQEYLEIAAEDRGQPEMKDIAADLAQAKSNARAAELSEELDRSRGLDDEMEL